MLASGLPRLSTGRLASLLFVALISWLLPPASAQTATRRAHPPFAVQFGNGCQTQVLCAGIERLGLYAGLRLEGTASDPGTERELAFGGTFSLGLDLIRRVALEASFPVGVIYRGAESTLLLAGPLQFGGRLRLGRAVPTLFSERTQPRLAWVLGAYVTLPLPNAAGDERHTAVLSAPQPDIRAAAELRWGPVQLVPSLGALLAEQAVYLQAGGRVSLSISQSLRFDLEAQSRISLYRPDDTQGRCGGGARVGLGLRGLLGKGVMGAAHYDHGSGDCEAAHRVTVGVTFAFGEESLRHIPTPKEAGVQSAGLGRVDPVLDCNGWMLDEATLMPRFKFGDPDPQDPNLIRRGEEVFRVGEHFEIDRSGRVYRPHQYVALAGEHAFTDAKTAEKLTLPVCEQGPKHRFFAHCQFFAKSLEKLAEAVQAVDEGHGAVAVQVRELQYEEECVSSEERQDPRELFIGLLKGLRGRARTAVRPPPPAPPLRKAPGDLANQPPPPYLGRPAPGITSHAGADGVSGTAAGAGGDGFAAGGSAKLRSGHPVKAADNTGRGGIDATPRKGKTFRGGSKHTRDKWYSYDQDSNFVRWWHRQGKREFGGNDIDSAAEAKAMYEHWLQLGKPVPR